MSDEEFRKILLERGLLLSDEAMRSYESYAALLKEWNSRFNLTAIDEREEVYEKHFLDCLLPLTLMKVSGNICDVGSGAGFPGLVWAIADPSLKVTLIEPTGKRCTFLEAVKKELSLNQVEILNRRAEDCRDLREHFDLVTARAVANLALLSELSVPLVKPGGVFAPLKGAKGEEELEEGEYALEKLGCTENAIVHYTLPSQDERCIILARKTKATPGKYPRNYSQIKKSPLKAKEK